MLDEQELADFAKEHVLYEVMMLLRTAAGLGHPWPTVIANALLESFLLHARNLDDFLAGQRSKPLKRFQPVRGTDVVAQDYARNWAPIPALNPGDRDYASQKVAHLTEFRSDKQPIDVQRIATQVISQFENFLATLEPARRAWFESNEPARDSSGGGSLVT